MTKPRGWKTKTARQMLLSGASTDEVMAVTGMLRQSIKNQANRMRKAGELEPIAQHTWIGIGWAGQVVEFDSMAEAERQGFLRDSITRAVNGKRGSYAGYKWQKLQRDAA